MPGVGQPAVGVGFEDHLFGVADHEPALVVGHVVGVALLPRGGHRHPARRRVPPVARGERGIGQSLPHPLGRGPDVGAVDEGRAVVGVHRGPVLQCRLEIGQGFGPRPVVVVDPAVRDVVDGCGVEVVELLPPPAQRGDEAGRLEHAEVLGHRLTGHPHPGAELGEREAVVLVEPIEQPAPGGIAQGPEDRIHVLHHVSAWSVMQPFGCMNYLSSYLVACQPRAWASDGVAETAGPPPGRRGRAGGATPTTKGTRPGPSRPGSWPGGASKRPRRRWCPRRAPA